MRLYKQKDIPKQHPNPPGHPPSSPSSSPGSPTPYKLRRAAEAVSKQISGHKAMVAQFKEMRLPRPPMFSTKPPAVPPKDRSLVPTQRKATKGPGEPQNVPEGLPIRTSTVTSNQRTTLSGVSTNSRSPAKPPGLGSEKATPSIRNSSSAPRTAPSRSQSISPPVRSSWQRAAVKPTTSRYERTSPAVTLADHSVTSSTSVDLQQPILFVSCFHSFEDDSELEDEDDSLEEVELSSGFESQVAQIFSRGLGSMSDSDIVRHGEVSPPIATPAVTLAPTVEPMSAVVEWWEPEANTAATCDVAINVKSKDPVNASDEGADPIPCIASTRTGDIHDVTSSRPSVSAPRYPTSVVRFDIGHPRTVLCRPPSSADYEVVASLAKGAFGAVALGIHKQSGRQCAIKVISNAIVKEQSVIRTVLEEQRIMREASGHPFLLGLLASFHDAHGLYLVSEYCRSTLFDERLHMPESYKKLASAELACAVDHIHSLGIVHRDIKLENVMLKNDGHVVLGDFGLAVRLESLGSPSRRRGGSVRVDRRNAVKTQGVCGTLPYMAPELLRNMEYSYGVDWFAYGVFLHVFYLDKFPWLGEYEHPVSYLKEMMSTISIGLVFEDGSFGDLLNKLFCIDQDARADFSVVRRATFFADFDWQSVIPVESPGMLCFTGFSSEMRCAEYFIKRHSYPPGPSAMKIHL
ncbi:kinase-like domain-containing protein [Russula brevipes]|nr:kinase-like domain-containing protein [Russula brevipes]